ncbi:engulfment and cell motility protein 3 isoform X1 [Acipenser ruthenus]|uniref:engulfment and cell motility protein 3 isoform X1 n=2 Tax=Acipenser ruthenus TaxID=7906 RepID=UPI00145A5CDD|nr:engulfment and cell motility protein 3 isoform X1 [Acipenser ruthenus]XP_033897228.1 engulfment and cell motility protein 3 isoform X1 [Acipenser ruthenus]
MPPQKDIVKIAIQMPGAYPQLIDLDQKKPLSTVIKEVCDGWNINAPEKHALQYTDGIQTYITESNRLDIKNGSILRLTTAPGRCADQLYTGIQNLNTDVKCDSLKQLAGISTDVTFAQEFINRDGHALLVDIVERGSDSSEVLAHALKAFMELMDHGIVSWENLSAVFIKKIAGYVSLKAVDASVQQLSLAILESMVLSSSSLFEQVQQEVTLEQLIAHLQVQNQQIQTKAMALLIALLQTAGDGKKREMIEFLGKKNLRQYINKNIIHTSGAVGDEMVHYLYVLQSVTLNTLEPKMRTPLDPYSQEQRDLLHGLRQLAFEFDSEASLTTEKRRSLCAKEFKKLGFSNNSNPGLDLNQTPPGLLALETMVYFSSRYPNAYSRFVLENSSREDKHGCPFARGSIQLTLILCEILRIGDPPSETGQDYYPLFFAQDRLLEELFCICIQLLNKTWKEMRATQEDFDKVMQVVREQITRTLSSKPTSLDLFKNKVNALNYSEILKLRQTERLHQEETLAPPVLELKERLKPELLELIRQQRLNRLCHGTLFRKISSRRRQDKLWYCRLSPNHKVLHYGDVDEESETPPIEALQEKIPVADIKALLTGKDCPHMKVSRSNLIKEVLDLAFTITYDLEEYQLNFVASSRTDFCLWTDGLNVLLGKDMTSECTQSELDILLSMEIKLRLLDLENIPIPDAPPPVPKPPSNLHFCYDFSQTEQ